MAANTSLQVLNHDTNITSSPLLRLAPELRNMIYRYTLVSDIPLKLDTTTIVRHKSLLDTCKEIQNEATSIFWGENDFRVSINNMREAEDALAVAGKANCQSITRLTAQVRLHAYAFESSALYDFRGITRFRMLAVDLATMLYNSGVRGEVVTMERKGLGAMSSLSARRLDNMIEQFHTTFLFLRFHTAHHSMTAKAQPTTR